MKISLERVEEGDAEDLASISKSAFHSDIDVGAPSPEPGGPPGYDSPTFQKRFMRILACYKILLDEAIVGGLYISSRGKQHRVLERIFVDPPFHNRGIATQAIKILWGKYSDVQLWTLGTPEWNVRTRHFYEKLGFTQVGWEGGDTDWRGIWYQKVKDPTKPYKMMRIRDLQDGLKDVSVEGKVKEKSTPRNVKSRSTGKPLKVANAELFDSSGRISLVLWNEQISLVKTDDRVRIEFGEVSSYMGKKQLNVGWMGKLIILL
ncbi:MAG: GNAT family N-acetyltransferase [Candidatus Hodarchaeales archaeon]